MLKYLKLGKLTSVAFVQLQFCPQWDGYALRALSKELIHFRMGALFNLWLTHS